MKRKRKNYQPEEKVAILKRHLVDKVPVSDLCDEYTLHPTVFYRWLKEFFEHGAAAFERDSARQKNKEVERIRASELHVAGPRHRCSQSQFDLPGVAGCRFVEKMEYCILDERNRL